MMSPRAEADDNSLELLVEAGRLDEAAEWCRRRLADSSHADHWLRQLGFVCFLNESNDAAYYEDAPRIFREIAERSLEDADAHFWLGYVRTIIESDHAGAEDSLSAALRVDPSHPYAHLVLSGIKQGADAVQELRCTLASQPGNLRAWRALAQELTRTGDYDGGRRALQQLVAAEPYVETRYGIMNAYVNEVLTGSAHASVWKREAEAQLQ